jgi:serine phosphatase RsbU (regulator of sigma subunit)/integral membrane sensor domain MASE1
MAAAAPALLGVSRRSRLALACAVFVAYLAGSEVALRIAEATDLSAVVFLPAGVTAAATLRTRPGVWPWVLAAAGLAELLQDLRAGFSVGQSLGFVAANVVEPLVAAVVIHRALARPLDLSQRTHVAWFLGVSVVAAPLTGGVIGATADRALGGDDFVETMWQWWLGDALGVLLIGTMLLSIGTVPDRRSLRSPFGSLLLVGSVAGTAAIVLTSDLPLLFVMLAGVAVAGAQFGVRAVAVTSLVIAVTLGACLLVESGSLFSGTSVGVGLLVAKLKLVVFTMAGLVIAAEVVERERMSEAAARLAAEASAEHAVVERLQQLLLPPEQMHGHRYDAFGTYLAATGRLGVGGDWYDASQLPDGRVLITVGDVVGRGAAAAAVMARIRAVLTVLAVDVDDAGELLTTLDARSAPMIDVLGTTVWAGLFDPCAHRLSYASAGHLPGFVIGVDGRPESVVRLDGQVSPPLGVMPDVTKRSHDIAVADGATLVLYTDGLVERRGETIDVGLARLERELRRLVATDEAPTPPDLVGTLRPSAHDDDTVILAVRLG